METSWKPSLLVSVIVSPLYPSIHYRLTHEGEGGVNPRTQSVSATVGAGIGTTDL